MSSSLSDRAGYWDRYADGQGERSGPEEAMKNAFGWTQYPGHGPGDELLGDPVSALELGFGRGDAVAALAAKGIAATGLDLSSVQCDRAREYWGHLPGACFEYGDAVDYLARTDRQWDAIYSIWGALWFTDPDDLLPRVHDRLAVGGRLVFSHAPPVPNAYGVQGMYGDGLTGRRIWIHRWAYEPDTWADILTGHGFAVLDTRIEPAPEPDHVGTLIVQALKP